MTEKKRCARCHRKKSPDKFYTNEMEQDGLDLWCKDCCTHRICAKCGEVRALSEFPRNATYVSGIQSWCNNCMYKTCTKCGKTKPATEFPRLKRGKNGRMAHCKDCQENLKMQYTFGISRKKYDEILKVQNGKCAICGKTPKENGRRLAVDHDHETDNVRGLLCTHCNMALGLLHDSPQLARLAAEYLIQHANR